MSTRKVVFIAAGVTLVGVLAGEFAGSRHWLDWLHPGAIQAMRGLGSILGDAEPGAGLSESDADAE